MTIRILSLFAVLVLALGATPSGTTESQVPSGPEVPAAALRVTLETTSDWTSAVIRPGHVAASRVVSLSSGADLDRWANGWRLRPGLLSNHARAVIDIVFTEPSGADTFEVEVAKGFRGVSDLTVQNQRSETASKLRIHNEQENLLDPRNPEIESVNRQALFGETPLDLPMADHRRLVLAFYYPWFYDYDDPRMGDRPVDPRSTGTAEGARSMVEQAAAHGVDGFVVSWAGERRNGEGFDHVLQASEAEGQTVTGYLEVDAVLKRSPFGLLDELRIREALSGLLRRADSRAFLRSDGVPVVFVFGMHRLSPREWQNVHDQLALMGHEVKLVGDATGQDYRSVSWGEHRYSPLGEIDERAKYNRRRALSLRASAVVRPGVEPKLFAATVAPGYDDRGVRSGNPVVDRDGGTRYEADWDAALTADPDWVLITSWNEWFEGTSVEPSLRYGDLALQQTAVRSTSWRTARQ